MNVTAMRLGAAPITIDWTNLASVPASKSGRGYGPDTQEFRDAWSRLRARFDSGEVGFFRAPVDNALSQAAESAALARKFLARGLFTDCLFLGIGGSALGPISLLAALGTRPGAPRFHFIENPDPTEWTARLSGLNPATTLVCIVTKSGSTFETLAQAICALEWLGRARWKTNLVALTDPAKGDLRAFAQAEAIETLAIAPSIGGRFSVFSPVGLFPAALAGLSVTELLGGAKQVMEHLEKSPPERSPLFVVADLFIQHFARRPVHVCMPYSTRLRSIGDWMVQMWAESLGKDGKGFTPLAAVGATDQHSILQLLKDGPDDKVTWFITVDRYDEPVRIPRAPSTPSGAPYPAFRILQGHTMAELLATEYQATSKVLSKQGRPNLTIQIDRLDERSVGSLFFALSALTAITGTLWGVNPFDQPGVEESKVYIREALLKEPEQASPDDDDNSPVARLRREQSN